MNPLATYFSRCWHGEPCQPIVFPFGKEEAERRVRERIKSPLSGFGREGFRGYVRNGRILLYWHKPFFGSTCPTVFRGVFVEADQGCRVEGRVSKIRLVPMIYYLFVGLAALFLGRYKPTIGFGLAAIAIVGFFAFFQRASFSERQELLSQLKAV